ncbi:MAG: NTP transferase domain-containing protein [Oscillospiraceae bacterium]|nr:NTP transferase domain-containing protein [Oscillospiraceae bacterium]
MDITLVILAAGIGSRFGGGVKQIAPMGPNGEIIIDYSIHDAIKAGFNKVIFVIRHDIYDDFKEVIGNRIEKVFAEFGVKFGYAFQEPGERPAGRVKPWGTGHAVMACSGMIDGPFATINADDYYGIEAYKKAVAFLSASHSSSEYGMIGYVLGNTLSENGGVTRGICKIDADGALCEIDETRNIIKTETGARVMDGPEVSTEALCSMNFWLLPAEYVSVLEEGFPAFKANMADPLKDEYLLPTINDRLLKAGKCSMQVVPTDDTWFGVTYQEDKPYVQQEFAKLYEKGVYNREDLYKDMR